MIMTTDSVNKNSPVRLLVLADDLTGALDTGTAVAAGSLRHPEGRRFDVIVSCDPDWPFEDASDQPDVLVIDTETRHLTAEETRSVIFPVVRRAAAAGIPHIYIKTDSAMRGNIGASFQAALDASGSPVLSFIPAFPQMDRTVRGGKVYIGGELLTDSFYAEDPLNRPVGADAGEIIRQQCSYPVLYRSLSRMAPPSAAPQAVELWDAVSADDLCRIRECLLSEGKPGLLAGCAGFAGELCFLAGLAGSEPGILRELPKPRPKGQKLSSSAPPLLVLCGSTASASRKQALFAAEKGFGICALSAKEKYCPEQWSSEDGKAKLLRIFEESTRHSVAAGSFAVTDEDTAFIEHHSLSAKESAARTSGSIARIFSFLINEGLAESGIHVLITGGDTLKSCLDAAGIRKIRPLYELMPGIVVSSVRIRGKEWRFISKSGGFGDADLFIKLSRLTEL